MPRGIPDCLTGDLADHATRAEVVALRALERQMARLEERRDGLWDQMEETRKELAKTLARVQDRAAHARMAEAARAPEQDGAEQEGGAE